MDVIGSYEERPLSHGRLVNIDYVEQGRRRHYIPVLLECDVTAARIHLRELKECAGQGLSFTAWVIECLAQAVSEHRHVQGMRKGRTKIVLFDDVDVALPIERSLPTREETLPVPCLLRRCQAKSVRQIHDELRAAQAQPVTADGLGASAGPSALVVRILLALPGPLRDLLVWRPLLRDPFYVKKAMGTVVVISVGMYGVASGSNWAIPSGLHPLVVALGGIVKKPGVVGESVEVREYLPMTIMFDHDVTDGAPVARFVARLQELLGSGYGLDNSESERTAPQGDAASAE